MRELEPAHVGVQTGSAFETRCRVNDLTGSNR